MRSPCLRVDWHVASVEIAFAPVDLLPRVERSELYAQRMGGR